MLFDEESVVAAEDDDGPPSPFGDDNDSEEEQEDPELKYVPVKTEIEEVDGEVGDDDDFLSMASSGNLFFNEQDVEEIAGRRRATGDDESDPDWGGGRGGRKSGGKLKRKRSSRETKNYHEKMRGRVRRANMSEGEREASRAKSKEYARRRRARKDDDVVKIEVAEDGEVVGVRRSARERKPVRKNVDVSDEEVDEGHVKSKRRGSNKNNNNNSRRSSGSGVGKNRRSSGSGSGVAKKRTGGARQGSNNTPPGKKNGSSDQTEEEREAKRAKWREERKKQRDQVRRDLSCGDSGGEVSRDSSSNPGSSSGKRRRKTEGLTDEEKEALKKKWREEARAKRAKQRETMTPDEREAMLARNREQTRMRRHMRSEEEKAERRRVAAEQKRARRMLMTPEKRREETQKTVMRRIVRMANMTEEEKEALKVRNYMANVARMSCLTSEEIERRKQIKKDYQNKRNSLMTDEEKARKKEAQKRYRENMTPEQRDRFLASLRNSYRRRIERLKNDPEKWAELKSKWKEEGDRRRALGKQYKKKRGVKGGTTSSAVRSRRTRTRRRLVLSVDANETEEQRAARLKEQKRNSQRRRKVQRKLAIQNMLDRGMTMEEIHRQMETPEHRENRLMKARINKAKCNLRKRLAESGVHPLEIERQVEELMKNYQPPRATFRAYKPRPDNWKPLQPEDLALLEAKEEPVDEVASSNVTSPAVQQQRVKQQQQTPAQQQQQHVVIQQQQPRQVIAVVQQHPIVQFQYEPQGHSVHIHHQTPHNQQQQQPSQIQFQATSSYFSNLYETINSYQDTSGNNTTAPSSSSFQQQQQQHHHHHHHDYSSSYGGRSPSPPPCSPPPSPGGDDDDGGYEGKSEVEYATPTSSTATLSQHQSNKNPATGHTPQYVPNQQQQQQNSGAVVADVEKPGGYIPKNGSTRTYRSRPGPKNGPRGPKNTKKPVKRDVVCDMCGNAYGSNYINEHKNEHHNPNWVDGKCAVCGEEFSVGKLFWRHFRYNHMGGRPDRRWRSGVRGPTEKRRRARECANDVVCEVCGNSYSKSYITEHKHEHHNPNFVDGKCIACGEEFHVGRLFYKHWKKNHMPKAEVKEGDECIMCEQCGKGFKAEEYLKNHMYYIHGEGSKEENYVNCNICNKKFKQVISLTAHMRKYHDASYKSGLSLINDCMRCGVRFDTCGELDEHVKTSHPDCYFPCQFCGRVRYSQAGLGFHIQRCNKKPKGYFKEKRVEKLAAGEGFNDGNEASIERTPMPCSICGKMILLFSLTRHFLEVHGVKEDEFVCLKCPKKFKRRDFWVAHLEMVHSVQVKEIFDQVRELNVKDKGSVTILNPEGPKHYAKKMERSGGEGNVVRRSASTAKRGRRKSRKRASSKTDDDDDDDDPSDESDGEVRVRKVSTSSRGKRGGGRGGRGRGRGSGRGGSSGATGRGRGRSTGRPSRRRDTSDEDEESEESERWNSGSEEEGEVYVPRSRRDRGVALRNNVAKRGRRPQQYQNVEADKRLVISVSREEVPSKKTITVQVRHDDDDDQDSRSVHNIASGDDDNGDDDDDDVCIKEEVDMDALDELVARSFGDCAVTIPDVQAFDEF